ncbi:MAG: molybdenum cofactor biosynthesis protein MoaE [Gammaproteobacteria bacterium]|nr:molybdenum cofactor biosynthesis protein MoaE [Gammaproteobacteria bacterium]
MPSNSSFAISSETIDPAALKSELAAQHAGACVTFEGWVRNINEGEAVDALEYETHAEIAQSEGEVVLNEALERFDIVAAHGVHRVGKLAIGDCAVWIGVSAGHRGAAFDACRYIIDEIKQRLPIWKKEHYSKGESAWVNCATQAPGEPPASVKA